MSEQFTVEEHPWPAVILHWVHLLSFFALIITGLIIATPPQGIPMQTVRTIHFISMFLFLATFVIRVYWALVGRSAQTGRTDKVRDWRHFVPEAANRGTLFAYGKYYLFIRKSRPECPKYNPLQKMTYGILFPLGIIWMAITGFTIYTNTAPYFAWFANLVGGLDNARLCHYFGMWAMIAFWMIHFYLTLFEEPGQLAVMLFRVVPGRHKAPAPSSPKTEPSKS